jgi:hypothetical protein
MSRAISNPARAVAGPSGASGESIGSVVLEAQRHRSFNVEGTFHVLQASNGNDCLH